jgi:hypothetical protein
MADLVHLTHEEMAKALPRITAWRVDPDAPVLCPRCEASGLLIIDRSARPYAEWYAIACSACGLDATINIPLGPPVMGGME